MAVLRELVQAPPLLAASKVGRVEAAVPVLPMTAHGGFGVDFEYDPPIDTQVWSAGPCVVPDPEAVKDFDSINAVLRGWPVVVYAGTRCRMMNEWDRLPARTSTAFDQQEWRGVDAFIVDRMNAGVWGGLADAGLVPLDIDSLDAAEQYIAASGQYGIVWMSAYQAAQGMASNAIQRDGDRLFTKLGHPVIILPEAQDRVYVSGQATIWAGERSAPRAAMEVPYTNEFIVLTERVFTVAVQPLYSPLYDAGASQIWKWDIT